MCMFIQLRMYSCIVGFYPKKRGGLLWNVIGRYQAISIFFWLNIENCVNIYISLPLSLSLYIYIYLFIFTDIFYLFSFPLPACVQYLLSKGATERDSNLKGNTSAVINTTSQ